jgi:hypothetical protein
VKRMALVLLFGSVLGFASTVLVSLALGSETLSKLREGLSGPGQGVSKHSEGLSKPSEALSKPSEVVLSKPLKFSCSYVSYSAKGVDFQKTKYVCFRRGAGQLRSFIHFPAGGSEMQGGDEPVGLGDEFVDEFADGAGRYRVVRVDLAPKLEGFDYVWAELIKPRQAPPR